MSGAAIAQEAGDVCHEAWKQSSASKSCTSSTQKFPKGCGGSTRCLPKDYIVYSNGLSIKSTKKLVKCNGELRFDEADLSVDAEVLYAYL